MTIVATHGWEKYDESSFGHEAIEYLSHRFLTPLENAGVNTSLLQEEWEGIVLYAKQYINLVTNSYKVVWCKLFNSPDAKKWFNVLTLVELIFTIPLSNSSVERCFSHLNLIKTNRRASLKEDSLDHLLRMNVEGPSFLEWDPRPAVSLWWKDKTRRINISDSRASRKSSQSKAEAWPGIEVENFSWDLSDWDNWLEDTDGNTEFMESTTEDPGVSEDTNGMDNF